LIVPSCRSWVWGCLMHRYRTRSRSCREKKKRNKIAEGILEICLIYPAESFGMRKSQPPAFSVMLLLSTWLMCVGGSLSAWFRGVEECRVDDGKLSSVLMTRGSLI
jgi:hypothetical protein